MTTPAQCSNCWYGQTMTPSGAGLTQARLCRANAPTPSNPAIPQPVATWPAVQDADWCGDGIFASNGKKFGIGDSTTTAPGSGSV